MQKDSNVTIKELCQNISDSFDVKLEKSAVHNVPKKTIMLSGNRKLTRSMKNKLDQRSKVESLIGLAKARCGLGKNRLKGIVGDKSMLF